MARKPNRFWQPARRTLERMHTTTRSLVARRKTAPNLEDIRSRLQLYLRAMYGQPINIESLTPRKKPALTTRAIWKLANITDVGISESDAECIRLPSTLPQHRADVSPLEQYRMIAVQHAERIGRASARHAREATSDLERDLYQLAEAAAVDAQIAASQPGLRATLDAARAESMAQRPSPRGRNDIERRVEDMVRRAWSRDSSDATEDTDVSTLPREKDAESNAAWARETATALEAQYGRKAALAYRRVPEMTLWKTTITTQLPDDESASDAAMRNRKAPRDPFPASQDARTRSAMPGQQPSSASQDKRGSTQGQSNSTESSSQTETKEPGGHADEGEPNVEQTPEANATRDAREQRAGATPVPGAEEHDDAIMGGSGRDADRAPPTGEITYTYPEWDVYAQAFRAEGTTVRVVPPSLGSSEWATSALHAHMREVHHAKRQFERLRSHRSRLRRQVQGDELDLEACVEAMVDRRMHAAPTDRLYSLVRPGRRELAITLLIDVSKSTGDVVAGEQRVIDVERVAALVATAAFDALGDDYSILAFSSQGASDVRVHTLKDFGEKSSSLLLQRISALAPRGTTRLGAAVRHAAATLSNHPAPHRLLLILSDGKPHDQGEYVVEYAIQDSRQAVMSARLQGIHPFCITVDASEGETYLAEIFGSAGYRVVSRPSQFSQALLLAVRRLIGGSD